MDVVFAALFNPTIGLIGPGNNEIYQEAFNHPLSSHAGVHDAAEYLYNYHGIGPGSDLHPPQKCLTGNKF